MKFYKLILFTLSFSLGESYLSCQTLGFSYDQAGNITERKLQVVAPARASMGNSFQTPDSVMAIIDKLKVYPNPASTYVNIEGDLPEGFPEIPLLLINITGQHIKKDVYTGILKEINVSDLKNGVYLLEMQISRTEKKTYKIIVSN